MKLFCKHCWHETDKSFKIPNKLGGCKYFKANDLKFFKVFVPNYETFRKHPDYGIEIKTENVCCKCGKRKFFDYYCWDLNKAMAYPIWKEEK